MTSRQRVRAALNCLAVDRVPVDLGGTGQSGIAAIAYLRLRQTRQGFGFGSDVGRAGCGSFGAVWFGHSDDPRNCRVVWSETVGLETLPSYRGRNLSRAGHIQSGQGLRRELVGAQERSRPRTHAGWWILF